MGLLGGALILYCVNYRLLQVSASWCYERSSNPQVVCQVSGPSSTPFTVFQPNHFLALHLHLIRGRKESRWGINLPMFLCSAVVFEPLVIFGVSFKCLQAGTVSRPRSIAFVTCTMYSQRLCLCKISVLSRVRVCSNAGIWPNIISCSRCSEFEWLMLFFPRLIALPCGSISISTEKVAFSICIWAMQQRRLARKVIYCHNVIGSNARSCSWRIKFYSGRSKHETNTIHSSKLIYVEILSIVQQQQLPSQAHFIKYW